MKNVMIIPAKKQVGNIARQQVMKLKLLIIQNTFKKIRSGNLQVSMLMMVFQAQTQKNAVNLIA